MSFGKHKTSARPGDPTYNATWSGYSAAPHCGCVCPKCGTEVQIEGDSHYCPWCDDYVNTGKFCDQDTIEQAQNTAYFPE